MIRTITPSEMKRVENRVMQETEITGEWLMQNAAAQVAETVKKLRRKRGAPVLCVCGTGNNGGDGMAAMRMLACEDASFAGICWILPGTLSADAIRERDRLRQEAGNRVFVQQLTEEGDIRWPAQLDCVIDALFGTGLGRPLEGLARRLCDQVNACGAPVVAVDIPSGLHGATGEVLGAAVCADCTVTFHRPKPGLYLNQGPDYAGKIVTADIGLNTPAAAALDDAAGMDVMDLKDLNRFLPPRRRVTHKGNYGRVLLFAGSRGMAGAAAISALAALRTGAGLVTVACPETIVDIVQILCPCATCLPLPKETEEAWRMLEDALGRADAVGAGCGLGQGSWAAAMVERLTGWLSLHDVPAVLDADALNLAARMDIRSLGKRTVITPHPAEAARLLHTEVTAVTCDAPAAGQALCAAYGVSAVVKGACSVLCAKEGTALNPFGTPAMAKGGSGDALTGIFAALLAGRAAGAYRLNDLQLMQAACALHGRAGEIAAETHGERGMLATDLCGYIGLVKAEADQEENQAPGLNAPARKNVTVIVEHPAGSRDEENRQLRYRLNCGYVQQMLEEENLWQDACILGCGTALEWFDGEVIAAVETGGKSIWAVAAAGQRFSRTDICRELSFLGNVHSIQMFCRPAE